MQCRHTGMGAAAGRADCPLLCPPAAQVPGKQVLSQHHCSQPRRCKTHLGWTPSKPHVWPHMSQLPSKPPNRPQVCAVAPGCSGYWLSAAFPEGPGPAPARLSLGAGASGANEEVSRMRPRGWVQPRSCPKPGAQSLHTDGQQAIQHSGREEKPPRFCRLCPFQCVFSSFF